MGSEVEPAKQLLPYLQRADELQKHEPLVAYYCRLFAMEKGLKIPNKDRTKTTNSLLVSLMNQLEKDKKSIKLSSEDNLYLEGFASNVFAKADRQDRAGRADLNTAKTFYAASIFFEILNQFGEAQPDIEQKQKYALWKAADIRKALKEGRKPEPGPPGGEDDLSIPSTQEPKSSEGDQYARYESFSAGPPGPEISSQHPQDTIPHSHATPPAPPSVHSGSDFDSAGLHRSPVSRHDDSAYQQPYQHQTQPSESVGLHGSPVSRHDDSAYQQPYQHQTQPSEPHVSPLFSSHEDTLPRTYSHEQQPPNVPFEPSPTRYPHESSPLQYSYPSFQTYPSFSESSLPTVPGHYSPYYQGPESMHLQQPPPPQNYMSSVQYDAGSGDGSHVGHAPLSAAPPAPNQQYSIGSANGSRAGQAQTSAASNPSYTYDSNYQPPVEKIAEAHKAARFAVGALAFDDVPVAVEFLRKSLELLTNPKAEIH